MLATGGSAAAALDLIKAAGARDVRLVCLVAAPEGVAALERSHPDVPIYTPVVDSHLNERKFIVPGPRRLRRSTLRNGVEHRIIATAEASIEAGTERLL